MMNFVFKTRNHVFKTRNYALKTRNCALKTKNCVLKTRNCALKTRNCVLKTRNFAGGLLGPDFHLGDDEYFAVSLPFEFPFYGGLKRSVRINANGYLTFRCEFLLVSTEFDPFQYTITRF